MARFLYWLIALPLVLLAGFFAIANREPVRVGLWPLVDTAVMPLFVVIILSLFLGFLFGALAAWWSGRRARQRARIAERRAERLTAELERLRAATPPPAGGDSLALPHHAGAAAPTARAAH